MRSILLQYHRRRKVGREISNLRTQSRRKVPNGTKTTGWEIISKEYIANLTALTGVKWTPVEILGSTLQKVM